jgi:cytochrome c oxidase subunit 3
MTARAEPDEQFETLEQQAHAARLGMWLFLASEVLLFSVMFALYATYRTHYPAQFHLCQAHNTKLLGSINTGILLVSSTLVAAAVHQLREGRRFRAIALTLGTIALGGVFLAIKITEYLKHFSEGIYPGGAGGFFVEHGLRGTSEFWTLYYTMTGLHALHVTIGMSVLAFMVLGMIRGDVTRARGHRLEIGAIYWHLVDLVWIFLWPIFYLA